MNLLVLMPNCLTVRGVKGGTVIWDPDGRQLWKRTTGSSASGRELLCITVETLRYLKRAGRLTVVDQKINKNKGTKHECPGYPCGTRPGHRNGHPGIHEFTLEDFRVLLLRHCLRLRIVLLRNKGASICSRVLDLLCAMFGLSLLRVAGLRDVAEKMTSMLTSSVESGILFTGGKGRDGEGPVNRGNMRELRHHFSGPNVVEVVHRYACCLEWCYWRQPLELCGIQRPPDGDLEAFDFVNSSEDGVDVRELTEFPVRLRRSPLSGEWSLELELAARQRGPGAVSSIPLPFFFKKSFRVFFCVLLCRRCCCRCSRHPSIRFRRQSPRTGIKPVCCCQCHRW